MARLWKRKGEGTSKFQLRGGARPAKLDPVLQVPEIARNPLSVAGLCDNGDRDTRFSSLKTIVSSRWKVLSWVQEGIRIGCTLSIQKHLGEQQSLAVLQKDFSVLNVWHARLDLADHQPSCTGHTGMLSGI